MIAAAIVHPKLAKSSFARAIRPLLTEPGRFEKLGIKLLDFSFPYLDIELSWHQQGANLVLRVDGTDFPYRPAGGWWIDSNGTTLLQGTQQVSSGNGFHTSDQTGRSSCWFCFRGWREYHNHVSHQDISWAMLRRDKRYSLLQIIMQLHKDLNGTGVSKV